MCSVTPISYSSGACGDAPTEGYVQVKYEKGSICENIVHGYTITDDGTSLNQALLFGLEDALIFATDPNYFYPGPPGTGTPAQLVINFTGETLTVTFDNPTVVYSGGPVTETVPGSEFTFTHNGDLYTVVVNLMAGTVTLSKNGDPVTFDSSTGTISP